MKNIAVIYGSDSSEWEVSVRSGEFTASQIDGTRYNVYEIFARFGNWFLKAYRRNGEERTVLSDGEVTVDKTDFSVMLVGEKIKFDYAYIMQHGTPGRTDSCRDISRCSAFLTADAMPSSPPSHSTSFHARAI